MLFKPRKCPFFRVFRVIVVLRCLFSLLRFGRINSSRLRLRFRDGEKPGYLVRSARLGMVPWRVCRVAVVSLWLSRQSWLYCGLDVYSSNGWLLRVSSFCVPHDVADGLCSSILQRYLAQATQAPSESGRLHQAGIFTCTRSAWSFSVYIQTSGQRPEMNFDHSPRSALASSTTAPAQKI